MGKKTPKGWKRCRATDHDKVVGAKESNRHICPECIIDNDGTDYVSPLYFETELRRPVVKRLQSCRHPGLEFSEKRTMCRSCYNDLSKQVMAKTHEAGGRDARGISIAADLDEAIRERVDKTY